MTPKNKIFPFFPLFFSLSHFFHYFHFCISRDACWIHVLRVLHSSVPTNDIETVETLLEQIFSQAPSLCYQVIAVIEDASVLICRVIRDSAVTVTSIPCGSKNSGEMDRSSNGGVEEGEGREERDDINLSRIRKPSNYSTHEELLGVPLITPKDIELLLVLSRAISSGQRVEGEPQLPAMLFDCTEAPPKGDLNISKAILMVTLCLACVGEYKNVLDLYEGQKESVGVCEVAGVYSDGGVNGSVSSLPSSSAATAATATAAATATITATVIATAATAAITTSATAATSAASSPSTASSHPLPHTDISELVSTDDTDSSNTILNRTSPPNIKASITQKYRSKRNTRNKIGILEKHVPGSFSYLMEKSAGIIRRVLGSRAFGGHSDTSASGNCTKTSLESSVESSLEHSFVDSEEHSFEDINWINSSKAIELVGACLYMSCCPLLVDRCVAVAGDTMESVLTARTYYEIDFAMKKTKKMKSSGSIPDRSEENREDNCDVIDSGILKTNKNSDNSEDGEDSEERGETENRCYNKVNITYEDEKKIVPLVIVEFLVAIFESVSSSRSAVLNSLLKGILICGDHVPYEQKKSTFSNSHLSSGSSSLTTLSNPHLLLRNNVRKNVNYNHATDQSHKLQSEIVHFANTVFTMTLSYLCSRQPKIISSMYNILDTYVPLLSLLPIRMLPSALFPIMRISGGNQGK